LSPGRCAALETSDPCPDDDGADLTGDCRADFVVAGTTVVAVFIDVDTGGGVRDWESPLATVEATTALGLLRTEYLPGPDGRRAILFAQPEQTQIVARSCVGEPCVFERANDAVVVRQVVGFPEAFASLSSTTAVEGGLAIAVRDTVRVGPGQAGPSSTTIFSLDATTDVDLPPGLTPTAIHVVPDRTGDGVADLVIVHANGLLAIDGLSLASIGTYDQPVRLAAPTREGNLIVVDNNSVQLLDDAFNGLGRAITGSFAAANVAAVTTIRDTNGDGVDDILLGVPADGAVHLALSSGGDAVSCAVQNPTTEFGASLRSLGLHDGAPAAVIGAPGVSAVELRTFASVEGRCETVVLGAPGVDAAVAPRFGAQLGR
jgi:hypothetical protein